jgi:hypothetical protein
VLSLACAAAQTSAAAAQDAAPSAPVEGWVVDAGTGAPITGAEVWAQGSAPAYTDADGFFSLGTMPAGERTLRAEHLTHAPREIALPFGEGHPRPRIALESDTAKARRLEDVRTMLRRDRRRGAQFYRVVERDELLTMSAEELHARARTLIPFGGPCELAPNTGRCLGSDGPLLVIDDDNFAMITKVNLVAVGAILGGQEGGDLDSCGEEIFEIGARQREAAVIIVKDENTHPFLRLPD